MNLFTIFVNVVLPIFILIGIGFALDRKFRLDIGTLGKLNFYVFVPALLLIKTLEAEVSGGMMMRIAVFGAVHIAVLFAVAWALFSWGPLRQSRVVLSMSAIFFNCGNYGIPLIVLAFGDSMVGALAALIMVQNTLNYTFGVWLMEKRSRSAFSTLLNLLKVPSILAVLIAVGMRALDQRLPMQVYQPLNYLSNGLIPVALLTLGAQLSRSLFAPRLLPLGALTTLRLAVSPLLAAGLAWLFGFSGALAAMLSVTAGLPVAINVYIIAAEYKHDEDLASQGVFWTTLLSAATIPVLLALFH